MVYLLVWITMQPTTWDRMCWRWLAGRCWFGIIYRIIKFNSSPNTFVFLVDLHRYHYKMSQMKPFALNNILYTCFESLWETTDLAAYGATINIVSPCSLTLTLSSLMCQNNSSSLDVHFSWSSKPMTLAAKTPFPRWKCKLALKSHYLSGNSPFQTNFLQLDHQPPHL